MALSLLLFHTHTLFRGPENRRLKNVLSFGVAQRLQIWRRVLYQKISALPFVGFIGLEELLLFLARVFPFSSFPSVELVIVPYFP